MPRRVSSSLAAGLLLAGVRSNLVPRDPMLLFVLLMESAMPSAQNSVIMLQVTSALLPCTVVCTNQNFVYHVAVAVYIQQRSCTLPQTLSKGTGWCLGSRRVFCRRCELALAACAVARANDEVSLSKGVCFSLIMYGSGMMWIVRICFSKRPLKASPRVMVFEKSQKCPHTYPLSRA